MTPRHVILRCSCAQSLVIGDARMTQSYLELGSVTHHQRIARFPGLQHIPHNILTRLASYSPHKIVMADNKSPAPSTTPSQPSSKTGKAPTYISSTGQTLSSLPLSARFNRAADSVYNFLGLYFVSLLALDPYAAAQNSRFNTRGPGRSVPGTGTAAPRTTGPSGTGGGSGLFGGGRLGGGGGAGPRGGGGSSGGAGRRMGTVDDVRGPECGSCG